MEIYAPIAHRLGISKIKVELDDLSLKYLEPEVYYDLVEKIALRKSEREKFVQYIMKDIVTRADGCGHDQSRNRRPCQTFFQYL